MTPQEHQAEAEAALADAAAEQTWTDRHLALIKAQVHATLATVTEA